MASFEVPAVCFRCGQMWPTGISIGDTGTVIVGSNEAGPCPHCGGWGAVLTGTVQVVAGRVKAILAAGGPAEFDRYLTALGADVSWDAAVAGAPAALQNVLRELPPPPTIRETRVEWAWKAVVVAIIAATVPRLVDLVWPDDQPAPPGVVVQDGGTLIINDGDVPPTPTEESGD